MKSKTTNPAPKIDQELIQLYVDEYSSDIAGCIPDLSCASACDDDGDLADAIEDFASGYIFDQEKSQQVIPEIRVAAKAIAKLYV